MSIVLLRSLSQRQLPTAQRTPSSVRSPEHADAPDDPVAALRHHRRQSSRLADKYFRFADDMACFFEMGGPSSPRAALEMMREAEQLRRSALESVAQLSLVLAHVQQDATAGDEDRGATVHHLALVKGSGAPGDRR